MLSFLFDVDGTLTPSRTKINLQFGNWMEHFATHNACYWVTGSPKYLTERQLGGIYDLAIRSYRSNKSQILSDFNIAQVVFFGDKTEEGGNDHEIAEAVKAGGGKVHAVNGWEDTWAILKQL